MTKIRRPTAKQSWTKGKVIGITILLTILWYGFNPEDVVSVSNSIEQQVSSSTSDNLSSNTELANLAMEAKQEKLRIVNYHQQSRRRDNWPSESDTGNDSSSETKNQDPYENNPENNADIFVPPNDLKDEEREEQEEQEDHDEEEESVEDGLVKESSNQETVSNTDDEQDDEQDADADKTTVNEDGELERLEDQLKRIRRENGMKHSDKRYKATGSRLPRDVQKGVQYWKKTLPEKCLAQGEDPYTPTEDWMLRAPKFVILGSMKCGTQALTKYFWQHPKIAKSRIDRMEMHFFSWKALTFTNAMGVRRKDGREMYRRAFLNNVPEGFTSKESDMVSFDSTPRYFLDADRVPYLMFCLVPWVKLVLLVRDPVERVLSHYNYLNQARRRNDLPMVSWREWINDDMKSLREAGVISNRTEEEFDAFSGSKREAAAWRNYVRKKNSQFLIGRGLYSIQLRLWYSAMDVVGKNRTDLMIIQSEKLLKDTQAEYSKALEFLGLDDFELSDFEPSHVTVKNETTKVSMPDKIRKELEQFYEPYNQQLYNMLGWEDKDEGEETKS